MDLSLRVSSTAFLTSALIVLSVIDWRTYEIPFGINIFILVLGILHVFLDHDNWSEYVIGFFLCQFISWNPSSCKWRKSHRWRRRQAHGMCRPCDRLAEYYISIFLRMHHRFCDTSDSYESNKRRQQACDGTVLGSRNIYFDAMGWENDIGIFDTRRLLKNVL